MWVFPCMPTLPICLHSNREELLEAERDAKAALEDDLAHAHALVDGCCSTLDRVVASLGALTTAGAGDGGAGDSVGSFHGSPGEMSGEADGRDTSASLEERVSSLCMRAGTESG